MFEGYGAPAALSFIAIGAVFEKFAAQVGEADGLPAGVAVLVAELVAVFVGVEDGVPVNVAVAVGQVPVPFVPTIWNTWSGAAASIPHVAPLGAQPTHAGRLKPPPGFCHAAAEFDVAVLSVHAHCPPGVKSILACTDTQ